MVPGVRRTARGWLRWVWQEGPRTALRALRQTKDFSDYGHYRGSDMFGNRYYENPDNAHPRNRFVLYGKRTYDPTMVPPQWYAWIHHMTDETPAEDPIMRSPPVWSLKHQPNELSVEGYYGWKPQGHWTRAESGLGEARPLYETFHPEKGHVEDCEHQPQPPQAVTPRLRGVLKEADFERP